MKRNEGGEISLTESLVRLKLCTSMVNVSWGFSSGFFPLAMVLMVMVGVASGSMGRGWGCWGDVAAEEARKLGETRDFLGKSEVGTVGLRCSSKLSG